jgi:hypothetical protein
LFPLVTSIKVTAACRVTLRAAEKLSSSSNISFELQTRTQKPLKAISGMKGNLCTFQDGCSCGQCNARPLSDMSPENWVYRVEGAMHLLFEHKKSPVMLRLANSKRRDADISKALKAEHCFIRAVFGQGPYQRLERSIGSLPAKFSIISGPYSMPTAYCCPPE